MDDRGIMGFQITIYKIKSMFCSAHSSGLLNLKNR